MRTAELRMNEVLLPDQQRGMAKVRKTAFLRGFPERFQCTGLTLPLCGLMANTHPGGRCRRSRPSHARKNSKIELRVSLSQISRWLTVVKQKTKLFRFFAERKNQRDVLANLVTKLSLGTRVGLSVLLLRQLLDFQCKRAFQVKAPTARWERRLVSLGAAAMPDDQGS